MRIVETDNFGGDYPDEKFLNLPSLSRDNAERIVEAINNSFPPNSPLYWKVVEDNYTLQPGFEP